VPFIPRFEIEGFLTDLPVSRRARIQKRWIILQIQPQLETNEPTREVLIDFLALLQDYGE
ncbi:MAG: hypothetical protein ACLFQP_09545, partial [Halothece sp.]